MDYLAKIKIQNGRINAIMRENGIKSQSDLARIAGVSQKIVYEILNFKKPPFTKNGWREPVIRISEALGVLPEDMFSEEQKTLKLNKNGAEKYITTDELKMLAGERINQNIIDRGDYLTPEEHYQKNDVAKIISLALESLSPQQKGILYVEYKVGTLDEKTKKGIKRNSKLSRQRKSQIRFSAELELSKIIRKNKDALEAVGNPNPVMKNSSQSYGKWRRELLSHC